MLHMTAAAGPMGRNGREEFRDMRRVVVLLIVAALTGASSAQDAPLASVPEGWTFRFPEGNAGDGMTVFMRMECYACHSVDIVGAVVPAKSGDEGPPLTRAYATLPREYLAQSIIKAHKVVAVPGYEVKEGQAGMGKYNYFMTIQELIDLVAFLEQLPGNPGK